MPRSSASNRQLVAKYLREFPVELFQVMETFFTAQLVTSAFLTLNLPNSPNILPPDRTKRINSKRKRGCLINPCLQFHYQMTGLNPDEDRILEVACLITDQNLNIISDEFNLVINQPKSILDNMNPWCIEQHSKSGLINESLESTVNISEAEEKLLKFIQNQTPEGECPLAGNSVYMDKLFLMKHMNRVANHLHYRIIDVSSMFELVRRWYPHLKLFKKNFVHRALPDIKDSILQLMYYREKVLKPVDQVKNSK